jgi:hypothetical protein
LRLAVTRRERAVRRTTGPVDREELAGLAGALAVDQGCHEVVDGGQVVRPKSTESRAASGPFGVEVGQ